MASPSTLREFRFKVGTTHRTAFENAAGSTWTASDYTAHKLRVISHDDSGLAQPGIDDETLQTRFYAKPAPIPGLRKGSLKIGTYCTGAYSNLDTPPEWNMAHAIAGGITIPTNARSTTAAADATTTNVTFTSANTYIVAGAAILVGTKGDARGNGEIRPVNSVTADGAMLEIATSGAASSGDQVIPCTAIYPNESATQLYIDTLSIGHGTCDQRQTIGCAGKLGISGVAAGDLPKLEFELMPTDHQWVAAGDRSSLTQGTAPQGGTPAFERAIGVAHIQDNGSSTRVSAQCVVDGVDLGIEYAEIPQPGGVNGIGGWQKMPSAATVEMTLLIDHDYGLVADFAAKTAKTVMIQWGHEATKACALYMRKCYLTELPVPAQVNNMSGMKVKLRSDDTYVSGSALRTAPWVLYIA